MPAHPINTTSYLLSRVETLPTDVSDFTDVELALSFVEDEDLSYRPHIVGTEECVVLGIDSLQVNFDANPGICSFRIMSGDFELCPLTTDTVAVNLTGRIIRAGVRAAINVEDPIVVQVKTSNSVNLTRTILSVAVNTN